ncbi:hypothetical protein Tco_0484146 [Tanacetum coccineum]
MLVLISRAFTTFQFFYDDDNDDDDDEESTIPLNVIISQLPLSFAITTVLPTMEPEDSLITWDENLSTIPEKESDEFIKSSVEDLVPIPNESKDTSDNDSESDMPFCDNSVTLSNPFFNSNDDFTSSDDESLPEEDVLKENFKIYSNPLFEFDDEYISSDVNPLFNEVLKDIEREDSYVSKLDEPDLLVTPLFDANKDKCFDPGGDIDEIDAFLDNDVSTYVENSYHDSEGDLIYLESLLIKDTILNLPPEIDIFLAPDDSIPPGIENNDYDSEGDVLFLEELLNNDSIPKYESFHVDFYNVPLSPRPPEKPPDDDGYLDIEPDTGVLIKNVVDDIL